MRRQQAALLVIEKEPRALAQLVEGVEKGYKHQTLLGATGTGKTFAYLVPALLCGNAAVWKPAPGELAAFPNLRVIFNLGAGESLKQRILPSGYLLFAEGCDRLVVVLVHPEYCV